MWLKEFSAKRGAAYLDAAATHVMSGLGVRAHLEAKSYGCTRDVEIVFEDTGRSQSARPWRWWSVTKGSW